MKSVRAAWLALGLALACLISAGAASRAIAGGADEVPPEGMFAAPQDEAPEGPRKVVIGAYINDIQEIDFRTHSYAVDLYVWLRWPATALDASQSLAFMNRLAPGEHTRELLYEKPKVMPDGSLYTVIRTQGRFSGAAARTRDPFDNDELTVVIEDKVSTAADMEYVPDKTPVTINPEVVLPGFKIGKPFLRIANRTYPTDFGDLSEPQAPSYSRVTIGLPISRPILPLAAKTFAPVLLAFLCAALVFFVRPGAVVGRIGLAIAALLALVGAQVTGGLALPAAGDISVLDKIHGVTGLFVVAVLIRAAATSWVEERTAEEDAAARRDRRWATLLLLLYAGAVSAVAALAILPKA